MVCEETLVFRQLEKHVFKWQTEIKVALERKIALKLELQHAKQEMLAMQERHASEVETLRNELVIARAKIDNLTSKESSASLENTSSPEAAKPSNRFGWLVSKVNRMGLKHSASDGDVRVAGLDSSTASEDSVSARKATTKADCRSTSWEVLSNAPGVVAFMCDMQDLRIQKATKKACKIWGSAVLHGLTLTSLSKSLDASISMKRSLEKIPRDGDAKAVDLGCIPLMTRSSKMDDFALVAVPLPEQEGDSDTIIIIADRVVG